MGTLRRLRYHWEPCDCAWAQMSDLEVCQHVECIDVGSAELHIIDTTTVEIVDFWIWPEMRGQGYGKKFLRYLLRELKAQGAEKVILHVEPENGPAVRLYTGAGFVMKCTELHLEMQLRKEVK